MVVRFLLKQSMWIKIGLLSLISLYSTVNAEGEKIELVSGDSLQARTIQFESTIRSYPIKSTYVRAIIWNTAPTSKKLESHFAKFDLLKFKEKWLEGDKFDIIESTELIYERFIYIHYPEQQSFVTVFVKLEFDNNDNWFSVKSIIEKVEQTLRMYGFIDSDKTVGDPLQLDSSVSSIVFTIVILIAFSYFIWLKFNRPVKKDENSSKISANTCSTPTEQNSLDESAKNNQHLQEQNKSYADLDDDESDIEN